MGRATGRIGTRVLPVDENGKLPCMVSNRTGTPAPDVRLDVDRLLEDDSIECGDAKPNFNAVFSEWTPEPVPEPTRCDEGTDKTSRARESHRLLGSRARMPGESSQVT